MPTWKKVIVSGSSISQLNNDAGYLTSATLGQTNGFATMSINGVSVIADSIAGSLVFASSSGAGLNIVGTSAPDTITFTLGNIPNASLTNSSVTVGSTNIALGATATTLAGLSSVTSTTFVGALTGTATTASNITPAIASTGANRVLTDDADGTVTAEANLTFDGATLTVAGTIAANGASGITTNQTTFPIATSTATAIQIGGSSATVTIPGNLTVNGTTTIINTTNTSVKDQFILLNSGSTGTTDGGIIVGNSATNNIGEALYWENNPATTGRWAIQSAVDASSAGPIAPNSYLVTVSGSTGNPTGNPLYGGSTNGIGNMYIDTSLTGTSDNNIWIWA